MAMIDGAVLLNDKPNIQAPMYMAFKLPCPAVKTMDEIKQPIYVKTKKSISRNTSSEPKIKLLRLPKFTN